MAILSFVPTLAVLYHLLSELVAETTMAQVGAGAGAGAGSTRM
jgi:hypothetical protein